MGGCVSSSNVVEIAERNLFRQKVSILNNMYHECELMDRDKNLMLVSLQLRLQASHLYDGMDDGHRWWFEKQLRRWRALPGDVAPYLKRGCSSVYAWIKRSNQVRFDMEAEYRRPRAQGPTHMRRLSMQDDEEHHITSKFVLSRRSSQWAADVISKPVRAWDMYIGWTHDRLPAEHSGCGMREYRSFTRRGHRDVVDRACRDMIFWDDVMHPTDVMHDTDAFALAFVE